jgi:hypothetical protein
MLSFHFVFHQLISAQRGEREGRKGKGRGREEKEEEGRKGEARKRLGRLVCHR